MKLMLKRITAIAVVLTMAFGLGNTAKSQGPGDFFANGRNDAELLLGAYLEPLGQSFGVNMNSGWINVGHPMKLGRFELKFSTPITFASDSRKFFNPSDLGLEGTWEFSNSTEMPNIMGQVEQDEAISFVQEFDGEEARVDIPVNGLLPLMPLPMAAQLSVGLVKGTELTLRFVPTLTADFTQYEFSQLLADQGLQSFSFGMWGVGVKHDVGQWIPVIKRLPFTLSASAAFSQLNTSIGYEYTPTIPNEPTAGQLADNQSITSEGLGQQAVFLANAYNIGIYASKKLPFITVYGGFRYMGSSVTLGIEGIHEYLTPSGFDLNDQEIEYNVNRVDKKAGSDYIAEVSTPFHQVGVTAGTRIKLGFVAISAEANVSTFTTVNVGLGFGWMD